MYGTVMLGRLAPGVDAATLEEKLRSWEADGPPAGFLDARVLVGDDDSQVVVATRFETREQYVALADTPEQDAWYSANLAPLLAGDPTWIDGTWAT